MKNLFLLLTFLLSFSAVSVAQTVKGGKSEISEPIEGENYVIQTGISESYFQSTMQTLITQVASSYAKNPIIFLENFSKKNGGMTFSSYEKELLLEAHSNYSLQLGRYNVTVLKRYKEYGTDNSSAKVKPCKIIKGLIAGLELLCALIC